MRKFILKAVVSAVGISIATSTFAQSEVKPRLGTSDTPSSDSTTLGQVVVTAQRRNEILAQTPIAASVLSGKELAEKGVVNADALQFASPSVAVNNYGQGTEFNIRGIGKAEMSSLSTTGVITYRDGVPSFPGYFQGEPYFDISNIQILRGPQGTVVGQNSTGGAVFVNTSNPIIGGDYAGYVSASTGNYNAVGLQGALNLPISDVLAARIAVFDERRSSFYTIVGPNGSAYNGNTGDVHQRAARLSFLLEPTDKIRVLWKTDTDDLDMGAYVASQPQSSTRVLPGATSISNNDLFTVSANTPQEARDTFSRHSLKLEYELQGGTKLRSVTGYGNGTTKWVSDFDGGAALSQTSYVKGSETQISQEFNIISSEKEAITWLIGAFSIHNTYDFPSYDGAVKIDYTGYNLPTYNYQFDGTISQDSQAIFGQVGYAITQDVKVDLGARSTSNSSINSLNIKQFGLPIVQNQSSSEQNTSYKVSLGWKVNQDNYVYATQSTGFKPGGINLQTTTASPASTFDKEEIKSLELGLKSSFASGKGGLTLTGFYNEYKGFQVTTSSPTGALFPLITNATETTLISGLEAEVNYKIGGWTLGGGFGLANTSLGQFYAVDSRGSPATCNQITGPATATCVNLSGRQLSYAPQLTYNVSAKYDLAVWEGKLTTAINFGHVDSQWATLFENAAKGDSLIERNVLNAQMTYQRGKTALTVYGTNLTNQQYVAAHWLASATSLDFAGPPRQYGVKVTQAF